MIIAITEYSRKKIAEEISKKVFSRLCSEGRDKTDQEGLAEILESVLSAMIDNFIVVRDESGIKKNIIKRITNEFTDTQITFTLEGVKEDSEHGKN